MNKTTIKKNSDYWIKYYKLKEHPEGGYYSRVYESEDLLETNRKKSLRYLATSIIYLLNKTHNIGYIHVNKSTIIHYHLYGLPIKYVIVNDKGNIEEYVLGNDIHKGHKNPLIVKESYLKGTIIIDNYDNSYDCAMISEIVVPGFDYMDNDILCSKLIINKYGINVYNQIKHLIKN